MRWAAVGSRLSDWIYMPKDDEFTVVNCLGRDVELRVREDGGGSGGGDGGGKARSFKLEAFKLRQEQEPFEDIPINAEFLTTMRGVAKEK